MVAEPAAGVPAMGGEVVAVRRGADYEFGDRVEGDARAAGEDLLALDRLQSGGERAKARWSVGARRVGVRLGTGIRLFDGGVVAGIPPALEAGRVGSGGEGADPGEESIGEDAGVDPRDAELNSGFVDVLSRLAGVEAGEDQVAAQEA